MLRFEEEDDDDNVTPKLKGDWPVLSSAGLVDGRSMDDVPDRVNDMKDDSVSRVSCCRQGGVLEGSR